VSPNKLLLATVLLLAAAVAGCSHPHQQLDPGARWPQRVPPGRDLWGHHGAAHHWQAARPRGRCPPARAPIL